MFGDLHVWIFSTKQIKVIFDCQFHNSNRSYLFLTKLQLLNLSLLLFNSSKTCIEMGFSVSLRFDIMASFVFGDCTVTNLEMELVLPLRDAIATAFLKFFDKYLLFLSWEDLKFTSTISFCFLGAFKLPLWTKVCTLPMVVMLSSCHYVPFVLLFPVPFFYFQTLQFLTTKCSFCFSLKKALIQFLAFSLSFSSYSVNFVALFWWYFALFFLFWSTLLLRFCLHFFILPAVVVCFSNFGRPISRDWERASSH